MLGALQEIFFVDRSFTFAAGLSQPHSKCLACREGRRVISRLPQTAACGLVRG